jgi:hypothetical protein
MTPLANSRIARLLGLVLGVGGGGAISYGQVRVPPRVSIIHLPATDPARPSAARVRHYVLRPRHRNSPYHLATADTTAVALLEGPTYGLYYAGQGRTDHSLSRYQLVYWVNHDLFWVEQPADLLTQRRVLTTWFKAVGLRPHNRERQRVQAKVESLMKENQKRVDSDIF